MWLYVFLALLMTFPLALHFRSALPAGSGDVWQNYWNFWWWKTSLFDLRQTPYSSPYLFFPAGASLAFHTHSPFNMIAGMPLNLLWGEAAAYNFCILLGLSLSGWGMYLLVRDLTQDHRAAFLAGIVFAYFPQRVEQTLEHLNLASVQFLPLTLWFFFRTARGRTVHGRTARGPRWRDAAGLGGCFALNALCSWHLGVMLLLLLGFAGVWELARARQPRRELVLRWSAAGVLAALLIAPAASPMIGEAVSGADYFRKPPVDRGIDAAYLVLPPYAHPAWGAWTAEAYANRAYHAAGFTSYLGFVPVALAVFGLWRRRPGALFWGCVGLGGLVLSLGSRPWWNGVLYEDILLPFAAWPPLPAIEMLRVANRFLIVTSIGLAVLAGFGAASVVRGDRRFLLIGGLVVFDYLWLPYPIRQVDISPLYKQLAQADGDGAVLDIPFHQRNRTAHNLTAQTVHQRPIGGGYISTAPPAAEKVIRSEPALAGLAGAPNLERPIDTRRLAALGFDWVVLHKDRRESRRRELAARVAPSDVLEAKRVRRMGGMPDETFDEIRRQLGEQNGPPILEDDKIVVFDLRNAEAPSP